MLLLASAAVAVAGKEGGKQWRRALQTPKEKEERERETTTSELTVWTELRVQCTTVCLRSLVFCAPVLALGCTHTLAALPWIQLLSAKAAAAVSTAIFDL